MDGIAGSVTSVPNQPYCAICKPIAELRTLAVFFLRVSVQAEGHFDEGSEVDRDTAIAGGFEFPLVRDGADGGFIQAVAQALNDLDPGDGSVGEDRDLKHDQSLGPGFACLL